MSYPTDNIVIMGLGLIGGSLARALRKSGFSKHFIGYGHRAASLERGLALGIIDEYTLDLTADAQNGSHRDFSGCHSIPE